jgi:hypothetical protein
MYSLARYNRWIVIELVPDLGKVRAHNSEKHEKTFQLFQKSVNFFEIMRELYIFLDNAHELCAGGNS